MNASLALLKAFRQRLAQEAAEDAGLLPVATERPRCPSCGYALECFYGQRSGAFLVIHGRGDCLKRWEQFGEGETEMEAWNDAKKRFLERNAH